MPILSSTYMYINIWYLSTHSWSWVTILRMIRVIQFSSNQSSLGCYDLHLLLYLLASSFLLPIIIWIPSAKKNHFSLPSFLNDMERAKIDVAKAFYALVCILSVVAILSIAMLYVSKFVMSQHASSVDDRSETLTRFRVIERNIKPYCLRLKFHNFNVVNHAVYGCTIIWMEFWTSVC